MEETPSKAYRTRWTTAEEMALVQAVTEREERLFGSMSGCGSTKNNKLKEETWQEVATILNSQFYYENRDIKTVKKKFYNLKGKAKAKNDASRRTGGGPVESFSQAESLLLDSIGSRASVCGISTSVDTDGSVNLPEQSKPCISPAGIHNSPRSPAETDSGLSQPNSTQIQKSAQRRGSKRKHSMGLVDETLSLDKERISLEIELLKEKIIFQKKTK